MERKKLYKTFQWVNLDCHLRIQDWTSIPTAKTNVWTAYRIIKDAIEDCSLYSHSWTERKVCVLIQLNVHYGIHNVLSTTQ